MNSSFLYHAWGLYSLECTREEYKGNTIVLHVQSKKPQKTCPKCGKCNTHKLGSTRMFLLGIQFATHLHQISGILEAQVDHKNKQIIPNLSSRSSVPNNLGYVIKAERIKEILDIIP